MVKLFCKFCKMLKHVKPDYSGKTFSFLAHQERMPE